MHGTRFEPLKLCRLDRRFAGGTPHRLRDLFGVPAFDFKGLPFAQRLAVHAGIGGMTKGLIRSRKEGVLTLVPRRAFASSCGSRSVGGGKLYFAMLKLLPK
jgi:hypothetical protein